MLLKILPGKTIIIKGRVVNKCKDCKKYKTNLKDKLCKYCYFVRHVFK